MRNYSVAVFFLHVRFRKYKAGFRIVVSSSCSDVDQRVLWNEVRGADDTDVLHHVLVDTT